MRPVFLGSLAKFPPHYKVSARSQETQSTLTKKSTTSTSLSHGYYYYTMLYPNRVRGAVAGAPPCWAGRNYVVALARRLRSQCSPSLPCSLPRWRCPPCPSAPRTGSPPTPPSPCRGTCRASTRAHRPWRSRTPRALTNRLGQEVLLMVGCHLSGTTTRARCRRRSTPTAPSRSTGTTRMCRASRGAVRTSGRRGRRHFAAMSTFARPTRASSASGRT